MERSKIISKTLAALLFGIAFGLMGQQWEIENIKSVQNLSAQQFVAHYKTTLNSSIVYNIFLGLVVIVAIVLVVEGLSAVILALLFGRQKKPETD